MTQMPKPDKDEKKTHGNFTKIPNMLCEGAYAQLEHDEKWLYVCIKALCKGKGTRFLSLRYISKKTGYPLSSLSKKLPRLHEAGLVHCEFKKRIDEDGNEFGNAQYHVTIADKWDENDAFYGVTCSPDEQDEGEDSKHVHDTNEPVHHANTSVRQTNEPVQRDERTRSRGSTSKDIEDSKDTSKIQEEEIVATSLHEDRNAPAANIRDLQKWKTDSEKRRALFADVPLSKDEGEDISMLETRKQEATDPQKIIAQTPAPGVPTIPPHGSDASAQALSVSPSRDAAQRTASPGGAVQASIPKRPLRKVIEKPQLTFGGQQVREWYEQARECKVRMTDKNVITLNRLADIDEMTQENLRDVLELYDTDKWLIDHNVTVDLQELEKQDGKFTFERGLLAVKRKRRAKGPAQNISKNGTDLNVYGIQALLDRQQKAM